MKTTVNGRYEYEIETENGKMTINGQVVEPDSAWLSGGHAHFIYQNRSYSIEIISEDRVSKLCTVKVNGNSYTVEMQDKYDLLLKQLGFDNSQAAKIKELKAPMPGLVLKIFVQVGMEVTKGDNLLVLEAMKMENMIKAPADGLVKNVLVSTGNKVEKSEVLIQFV